MLELRLDLGAVTQHLRLADVPTAMHGKVEMEERKTQIVLKEDEDLVGFFAFQALLGHLFFHVLCEACRCRQSGKTDTESCATFMLS